MSQERKNLSTSKEHDDYFLIYYDDGLGNIGNEESPIKQFFIREGFRIEHGYWGMPWYFVDTRNKFFIPDVRPGRTEKWLNVILLK